LLDCLYGYKLLFRQQSCVVCITASKEPDVETASNSSVAAENISSMTDSALTIRLFDRLLAEKPVTVEAKLPVADDARALIAA